MFKGCKHMKDINGYYCKTEGIGILIWESLDPDNMDRSIQPVYYRLEANEAHQNKLNSYQDHQCDAFYNSQKRMSRFPGLIWGGPKAPDGRLYEVYMTGTPAKKMRWRFITLNKDLGMTVRIVFPSALSRSALVDGEEVPYNEWVKDLEDPTNSNYGPILQTKCGENRYIGVKNIFEFYIDGHCDIEIIPRDAIQTQVRMEWTMDEFFASGGTTAFVDRLCASLGIHASTVKVVGPPRAGSVIVDYEITPSADEPLSIEQISARQTQQFATGAVDLGAPILDVS